MAIRLNMKKADRRASLAMTNEHAQDDKDLVIANRFAVKYSVNQAGLQAKRCGNPPEKKTADRRASLAMTKPCHCEPF